MMGSNKNKITSGQLLTFIMSVQIGLGILTSPSVLVKRIGHDSWISVFITGFIYAFLGVLIIIFLRRYKDKSIMEINYLLYTKIIGYIINLLIIAYLFFATVLALRLFTEIINIGVLKLTPGVIIAALLIIPFIHMTWYGLKTICRFDRIIVFIMVTMVLFFMLFLGSIRYTFLMPVGQTGLVKIIKGIVPSSLAFLGIELIVVIYPDISDKGKLIKSVITANIATTLFYVLLIVVLTGVFGENLLKHLVFPLFSLARAYNAPTLERLDLFFVALWLPAMGITMTGYYYCTLSCLEKLLNTKKSFLLHMSFCVAVVFASRIPPSLSFVFQLTDTLNLSGLALIAFILFSLLLSYLNTRGVMKK